MTDIELSPTQSSPFVAAQSNAGILEMRGDSYPENSFEFFAPILEWLHRFFEENDRPLRLELHLLYLNTSSVKAMMDIFDLLEEQHSKNREVAVCWFYDAENERIAELAEEFKEDCTFHFEIVRNAE